MHRLSALTDQNGRESVRRELRAARDKRGLRDGRRPGRNARDDGARRKAGVLRLLRGSYKGQHRRAVARERPLNRLVIQMADLAGRIGGAGVIVPDASERHGNQQQRQQRYRNHYASNWLRSAHPCTWGLTKARFRSYSRCPGSPMGCAPRRSGKGTRLEDGLVGRRGTPSRPAG
jgi:hypothetical protein